MLTLETLKVIIMACHLGASGMGGEYIYEHRIKQHQKQMVESNLLIQRQCQSELITCAKKNKLEDCLEGSK